MRLVVLAMVHWSESRGCRETERYSGMVSGMIQLRSYTRACPERCLSATVDGSRMQEHIMIGVFLLHVVKRVTKEHLSFPVWLQEEVVHWYIIDR